MASETLTFSNDPISLLGLGLVSGAYSGQLTMNYNPDGSVASVNGNLSTSPAAGNALPALTYTSFSATYNSTTQTYTVSSVDNQTGLTTFSTSFVGQAPTTSTSQISGLAAGLFSGAGDAVSSSPTVCFRTGTLIRTAGGDVAVEKLVVGDLIVTTAGAHRPIKWLGHRVVDCSNHPRSHEVMPVHISAHAFGDNRPARDLFVSPGHAICVDMLGEVLIPAIALVNGSTIQLVEVDEVTYWHVELESHDIILAENMPAESYLEMNNRSFFQTSNVVDLVAGPDGHPAQRTHADFCRPFYDSGVVVDAVRARLRKRAEESGWALTYELDLHLLVDGQRIEAVVHGLTARFNVPTGAKDVWLISPTSRPSETIDSLDVRDLGVCIAALRIEDGLAAPRDFAIDDPALCIGFHSAEEGVRRWTAGRARLPQEMWQGCEDGFYLRLELACHAVPRWVHSLTLSTSSSNSRKALALVA